MEIPSSYLTRRISYLGNVRLCIVRQSRSSSLRWRQGRGGLNSWNHLRNNSTNGTSPMVTPYTRSPSCSIGSLLCFSKSIKQIITLREQFFQPIMWAALIDLGKREEQDWMSRLREWNKDWRCRKNQPAGSQPEHSIPGEIWFKKGPKGLILVDKELLPVCDEASSRYQSPNPKLWYRLG